MAIADATDALSARRAGLMACPACGALHRRQPLGHCRLCGHRVASRKPFSLQRCWAFLFVGLMCYIPSMLLPIMKTRSLGSASSDTISSGILALAADGSYVVAGVVFVASICIPLVKFVVIAALALSLHFRWAMPEFTRQHLHAITEFIGRWSMIDVFVVAVLAALIRLGSVMEVEPGLGINLFALSVVFTMFAATALDPRLFWDRNHVA